jgi:hypothetical protein
MPGLQFTLRTIFVVTTLAAVACAAIVGQIVPQILGATISTAIFVAAFLGFLSLIRD